MKKPLTLMQFPSFPYLLRAAGSVFQRFPIPILIAIIGSSAMIAYSEYESNRYNVEGEPDSFNWLLELSMTCLIGLPLLLSLVVFSEERGWADLRKWGLQAVGLGLCAIYYVIVDVDNPSFEHNQIYLFFGFWAVAHLLVALAPYLNSRSVEDFWTYNTKILGTFAIGAAYTIIIWLGISGALLAVDNLFDININWKIYTYSWILLSGVFNTFFFLSNFPKQFEFGASAIASVLVKFILIPLSILYLFILYAFSAKILLQWRLPHGWVASLVIGFAAVGVFSWLLNFALARRGAGEPHKVYSRWFWPVLLPMVVLLFVGIGKRISDYGVTEDRYIVAYLGVWLLLNGLYYTISKRDNLKFIPISLGVFILFALIGPLSMFDVSHRSQVGILREVLERNDRWENGQAKPSFKEISDEDALKANGVLDYLCRYSDYKTRGTWAAGVPDSIVPKDRWSNGSNVAKWLGLKSGAIVLPVEQSGFNVSSGMLGKNYNFTNASIFYFNGNNDEGDEPIYFNFNESRDQLIMYEKVGESVVAKDSFSLSQVFVDAKRRGTDYRRVSPSKASYSLNGTHHRMLMLIHNCNIETNETRGSVNYLQATLIIEK